MSSLESCITPMIFNETHSSLNTGVTPVIHCACGQATWMYVAMTLKIANHMKLATSDPLISSFNTVTHAVDEPGPHPMRMSC